MKITEVRIFKKNDPDKKLRAFATITFDDCFVVRDVKVIEGSKGMFVAMPSRRLREPCPKCGHPSEIKAHYCSQCGAALEYVARPATEGGGPQSEHKDIAHPITPEFREYIQKTVLEFYRREQNAAPSHF